MLAELARRFCGHQVARCDHEWETSLTTVAGPLPDLPTTDSYSVDMEERLLMGVTTVLRVCKKGCGAQDTIEMLGIPKP